MKKVTSAPKIIEEEDHNNNTQEKIVMPDINENEVHENEETHEKSENEENDQSSEIKSEETKKTKKAPKKPVKYSKSNKVYTQATLTKKKKEAERIRNMTDEERAEYNQAKLEKRKARAEQKLAIQEKFMIAAEEQRQKRANMTKEEKAAYNEKVQEKTKATKERKQAGLVFPVNRVKNNFRKRFPSTRHTYESAVFTAAVLEYMTAELLELAGNVSKEQHKRRTIKPRDIMIAARSDDEIDRVVGQNCLFEKAGRYPVGVQQCLLKTRQSRNEGQWNVDLSLRNFTLK